jgi:hypothetical protein
VRIEAATVATISVTAWEPYLKPLEIPLVVAIKIKRFSARVLIKIKSFWETSRVWVGFYRDPEMKLEVEVEPIISNKLIKLQLVDQIIQNRIKEALEEFVVLPNMDDISFWASGGKGGIFWDTDSESEDDEEQGAEVEVEDEIDQYDTEVEEHRSLAEGYGGYDEDQTGENSQYSTTTGIPYEYPPTIGRPKYDQNGLPYSDAESDGVDQDDYQDDHDSIENYRMSSTTYLAEDIMEENEEEGSAPDTDEIIRETEERMLAEALEAQQADAKWLQDQGLFSDEEENVQKYEEFGNPQRWDSFTSEVSRVESLEASGLQELSLAQDADLSCDPLKSTHERFDKLNHMESRNEAMISQLHLAEPLAASTLSLAATVEPYANEDPPVPELPVSKPPTPVSAMTPQYLVEMLGETAAQAGKKSREYKLDELAKTVVEMAGEYGTTLKDRGKDWSERTLAYFGYAPVEKIAILQQHGHPVLPRDSIVDSSSEVDSSPTTSAPRLKGNTNQRRSSSNRISASSNELLKAPQSRRPAKQENFETSNVISNSSTSAPLHSPPKIRPASTFLDMLGINITTAAPPDPPSSSQRKVKRKPSSYQLQSAPYSSPSPSYIAKRNRSITPGSATTPRGSLDDIGMRPPRPRSHIGNYTPPQSLPARKPSYHQQQQSQRPSSALAVYSHLERAMNVFDDDDLDTYDGEFSALQQFDSPNPSQDASSNPPINIRDNIQRLASYSSSSSASTIEPYNNNQLFSSLTTQNATPHHPLGDTSENSQSQSLPQQQSYCFESGENRLFGSDSTLRFRHNAGEENGASATGFRRELSIEELDLD